MIAAVSDVLVGRAPHPALRLPWFARAPHPHAPRPAPPHLVSLTRTRPQTHRPRTRPRTTAGPGTLAKTCPCQWPTAPASIRPTARRLSGRKSKSAGLRTGATSRTTWASTSPRTTRRCGPSAARHTYVRQQTCRPAAGSRGTTPGALCSTNRRARGGEQSRAVAAAAAARHERQAGRAQLASARAGLQFCVGRTVGPHVRNPLIVRVRPPPCVRICVCVCIYVCARACACVLPVCPSPLCRNSS